MQTSAKGVAFLERHEGVVLKAYRDPVGIWTIGAGLTSASGVVKPRAGMIVTAERASQLLMLALQRSYEPAVTRVMPGARQHEFDGAVSFHWNTGAIGKASWVRSWIARNWGEVERRLKLWNKGGGRVLPGLARRRAEEYQLIRYGDYGTSAKGQSPASGLARFVISVAPSEIVGMRRGFADLGFAPGTDLRGISTQAVRDFQKAHDLTVDGLIGRATLSTLQRRLDARSKTARDTAVGATATAGGATAEAFAGLPDLPDWMLIAFLALAAGWALYRAIQYRDALAAKAQTRHPALSRFLRSF